jgi:hypothetical protein
MFLYNGPPTLGNLVYSNIPLIAFTGTPPPPYPFDGNGNRIFPGETVYNGAATGVATALNLLGTGEITWFISSSGQPGPYTQLAKQSVGGTTGQSFFWFQPGLLILNEVTTFNPAIAGPNDALFADSAGRPAWWTNGNPVTAISTLTRSQSDTSVISVSNTGPVTALTATYTTDPVNGMTPGTVYTLKTWFNGTFQTNGLNFFATLAGVSTQLVTVSTAFASGTTAGHGIGGWLKLEIIVISASQVRVQLTGGIHDLTQAVSATAGSIISSNVFTIPFSGGDITLGANWGAATAGQAITSQGSHFTRRN